jgi:hypothetical protein
MTVSCNTPSRRGLVGRVTILAGAALPERLSLMTRFERGTTDDQGVHANWQVSGHIAWILTVALICNGISIATIRLGPSRLGRQYQQATCQDGSPHRMASLARYPLPNAAAHRLHHMLRSVVLFGNIVVSGATDAPTNRLGEYVEFLEIAVSGC